MFHRVALVKLAAIASVFLMVFSSESVTQVRHLSLNASDSANTEGSSGDVTPVAENSSMILPGRNAAQLNPQVEFTSIRLTNNSAESIKPRVVVDNLYLYLVWEDTRDGNREVYWQKFDRSTAQSITQPIRLTTTGDVSFDPAIAIDASGNSYVVWQEGSQYGTIFGAKIDPNGTIIIPPVSLSPNLCLHPDISAVAPGVIWVVFERRSVSDQDVYVRKFNSSFIQQCQRRLNKGTLPAMDKCPAVVGQMDGGFSVPWRDMDMWWTTGTWFVGVSSSCGATGDRLQANGDYQYPSIGYAAEGWVWVNAWMGNNVYNLYGTNSLARINDVAGTAGRSRVGDDPNYAYCVWSDNRDGNSEIYLSQAYSNTPFPDTRLTNNSSSSQAPDIATYNPEPGKWWVVWHDNRDGNWEIYLTSSQMNLTPVTLTVKRADGTVVTTEDATVTQYRWGGSSWNEVDEKTTDGAGNVTFNLLTPGDALFARRMLSESELGNTAEFRRDGQTNRELHIKKDNVSYVFFVYDENTKPDLSYEILSVGQTEIVLDHRIARMNLVATFDYDVDASAATLMEQKLTVAAQRLYNATNGQFWIDTVTIYDRAEDPEESKSDMQLYADIRIARKLKKPITGVLEYPVGKDFVKDHGMPESDWDKAIPELSDFKPYYDHLPFRTIYRNPATYDRARFADDQAWDSFSLTLHHELGHYLFSLGDESELKRNDSRPCLPVQCTGDPDNDRASIMTYPIPKAALADGTITEFCHHDNHRSTLLWNCWSQGLMWTNDYSCWDAIVFTFPWLKGVNGDADENFGPLTEAGPKFGIDGDVANWYGGIERHFRIHRPVSHSQLAETGDIKIKRGTSILDFPGRFEIPAMICQVNSPEWTDIRPNDRVIVIMNGYVVNTTVVLPTDGAEIDITMAGPFASAPSPSWLESLFLNPQPLRLTLPTAPVRDQKGSQTLNFRWQANDLPAIPVVQVCDWENSCQTSSLTPIDTLTYEAVLTVSDSCNIASDYVLSVATTAGDSVLAYGTFVLSSGDEVGGGSADLGDNYHLWFDSASFATSAKVLLVTLGDVTPFSADGRRAVAEPVAVAIEGEDSQWPDSGRLAIIPDGTIDDTSSVTVLMWHDNSWIPLSTEYDPIGQGWGASIGGNGLYALAAKSDSPAFFDLVEPSSGGKLMVHQVDTIRWVGSAFADSLMIVLSLNGGITFPTEIYRNTVPSSSRLLWRVPDQPSCHLVIKAVLFDSTFSCTAQSGKVVVLACGDVDASCQVDLSDAVYLVVYIFGDGSAPDPLPTGDVNCDGRINLSDAVYLINYIFGGGAPPCAGCK